MNEDKKHEDLPEDGVFGAGSPVEVAPDETLGSPPIEGGRDTSLDAAPVDNTAPAEPNEQDEPDIGVLDERDLDDTVEGGDN